MTDLVFGSATVLGGAGNPWLTGVSDLDIAGGPGGPRLYATTGPGGGVAVYALATSGALTEIDRYALSGLAAPGIESRLIMTPGDMALVTGMGRTGLWGIGTDTAGRLTSRVDLGTVLPADLSALSTARLAGSEYLFGLRLGSEEISVWEIADGGRLSAVSLPGGAGPSAGAVLTDIETITLGSSVFLVATSAADDALICWRVGADGLPAEVTRVAAATGLGIDGPMALTTAVAGGAVHAVFVAAGTGTLTVARIGTNGSLAVTDHVMDDIGTRFQGARIVESIVVAGRTYVVVAGADDGITVFELLPGGRLLDRATLADSAGRTLDNVAAVALAEQGGDLQIMVTSATEPGITQVALQLGSGQVLSGGEGDAVLTGGGGDDLIAGGAGDDQLTGGTGNDVLMDRAGQDTLTGGRGRDIFVIAADGQADRITDFNGAADRLDLSAWANLRAASQLTITPIPKGAEIRYGSEVLVLQTANGKSLSASGIGKLEIVGLSRLGPGFVSEVLPPMTFRGGEGVDRILASNKGDRLYGAGGDDSLGGAFGNDLILGEAGNDTLSGDEDDDRLDGGDGSDLLRGGEGDDRLDGGAGDDIIEGDDGNDAIRGGAGANRLHGGAGRDTVTGGAENDLLWGGAGADELLGGAGDDRFSGGTGNDVLRGEAGHDVQSGEDGWDLLFGGEGNDLLSGGEGGDTLCGDAGDDVLGGGGGRDRLYGHAGQDRLRGDAGEDQLFGQDGNDTVLGGDDNDLLSGGAGRDTLWGGAGRDTLRGGAGSDTVDGGRGDDSLSGGDGNDLISGGAGHDTAEGNAGHDVILGDEGSDMLLGGSGADVLRGGAGRDMLWGGTDHDTLRAGTEADTLWGGSGNDALWGEGGDDMLWGEAGDDRLTGGAGADRFVFGSGQDVITDFANNSDEILLSRRLWPDDPPAPAAIVAAAVVTPSGVRLNLPGGHSLMIEGLSDPRALVDDIVFV